MTKTRLADLAWAAGFIDGDGSIFKKRANYKYEYLSLGVDNSEREPLDRLVALFGGKVNGPYRGSSLGKKPRFQWVLIGTAADLAIQAMWPWLCSQRRHQYESVITQLKEAA
jgi:hypothetical protein